MTARERVEQWEKTCSAREVYRPDHGLNVLDLSDLVRMVEAAESDARREEQAKVQRLCEMVEALLARDDFWKRPDLVGFVPGEFDDVADALRALGRLK